MSNHLSFLFKDPYQRDYEAEEVPKDKCRKECDSKAACGCGLVSGVYSCLCEPGYYGNGAEGNCSSKYYFSNWNSAAQNVFQM